MRLILLFSALLAALTGVGASARAAAMPAVEQHSAAAQEATVLVAATFRAATHRARHHVLPAPTAVFAVEALAPLYQDKPLE